MSRKVFDRLASGVGVVMVVVLLVAGGLLTWGHSFAQSNVHNQLAHTVKAQYAKGGQKAVTDPEFPNAKLMIPALEPYAGKQLLTGKEAQVYANDFIGQHLYAMPLHGVYSQVSTAARTAKPGSKQATELTSVEATVFQGTTLRGLLLEAYGFGTIATIMLWALIASFALAFIMAVLVGLGFWHAAQTAEDTQLMRHETLVAA
jgi:hypothetical protein